ncbi:hypothetical protein [Synechococcus phage MC09]
MTTANLTVDTAAVEFYNQFAQQVETFGILNVLDEREDRILFNRGKKAIQAVLDHKNNQRVAMTEDEILPIVEEYLRSYTEEGQVKVFDRHVAKVGVSNDRADRTASAMAIHGQICYVDTYNDAIVKSFDRMGNTLKSILADYNDKTGTQRFAV